MSELDSNLAAEVLAACRAGAAEAAEALGRALDGEFALTVGEVAAYSPQEPPGGFDGPGLVLVLEVGGAAMAAILPEATGLLPSWYSAPDPTGASKLQTLAQELSLIVLPATHVADKTDAMAAPNLADALSLACPAGDAALATIDVASGSHAGQLSLVWPLAAPQALLPAKHDVPSEPLPESFITVDPGPSPKPLDFSQLPSYSRSLLKIRVPVSVNLAVKKESVQEVVELVPGSIIKFEKGCDELLQMVVGGQTVAEGEAVKIGDKFGFRVTGMILPREHFIPMRRPRAG